MAAPQELLELLGRIKQVRSPLARMRLLARGWKSLRRMSGTELRQLASQLGFEGADELVSKLARDEGRVDRKFLESLLRRARGADLEELSQVARDLRDPQKRVRMLEKGLDFVVDELSDDDQAAQAQPAPDSKEAIPLSDDTSPRTRLRQGTGAPSKKVAATAAAAGTAAVVTGRPRKPATTRSSPVRPQASRASESDAPQPASRAAPPAPPATAARQTTAPEPAASPELPPRPPIQPAPARPGDSAASPSSAAAARQPAAKTIAGGGVAARVREARGPLERSRLLRGAIESVRGSDVESLRELVTAFPDGWQRRRALVALLQHRIPDDLHEAVFLIETLESTQAGRWCVTTILDRWELSAHEREGLIERHGLSPVRARRLRRSAGSIVTHEAQGS